jgi:hypothetical protein
MGKVVIARWILVQHNAPLGPRQVSLWGVVWLTATVFCCSARIIARTNWCGDMASRTIIDVTTHQVTSGLSTAKDENSGWQKPQWAFLWGGWQSVYVPTTLCLVLGGHALLLEVGFQILWTLSNSLAHGQCRVLITPKCRDHHSTIR